MTLKHAFKEWAAVCEALEEGKQAVILRKGGIAEAGSEFEPEHKRFWLYPTYGHQRTDGIKPDAVFFLARSEERRPSHGRIRLSSFAEVTAVYHVHELVPVLLLGDLHIWSEQTVRDRFAYRRPGLYVLAVRIHRAEKSHEIAETEAYAGCRTWVELERPLSTAGAKPVIDDAAMRELLRTLDTILNPTAFA